MPRLTRRAALAGLVSTTSALALPASAFAGHFLAPPTDRYERAAAFAHEVEGDVKTYRAFRESLLIAEQKVGLSELAKRYPIFSEIFGRWNVRLNTLLEDFNEDITIDHIHEVDRVFRNKRYYFASGQSTIVGVNNPEEDTLFQRYEGYYVGNEYIPRSAQVDAAFLRENMSPTVVPVFMVRHLIKGLDAPINKRTTPAFVDFAQKYREAICRAY
jgi:hypothetical protein